MRKRNGLTLCTAICVLTIILRHHLVGLYETASTYASFYPWLNAHPETLYTLASNQTGASSGRTEIVPRILHHIFLSTDDTLPERYAPAVKSCTDLHANWTHRLWTTSDADQFMHQNYPTVYPHYIGYKQTIQRANILRYALLHHHGGIYLDIDVQCLQPLDSLLHLPLLSPGAYPAGVNNAFILARPNHGFLGRLLEGVPGHDLKWGLPYVENMFSTGCMYFSNQWMHHVRSVWTAGKPTESEEQAFVLADENGSLDSHMLRGVTTTPLFHHGGASSWHNWDAALIIFVGKHYPYIIPGLAVLLTGSTVSLVILAKKRRAGSMVDTSRHSRFGGRDASVEYDTRDVSRTQAWYKES